MYQARSLIASDNSGLSDPFARVIIGEHCRETQVSGRVTFDLVGIMDMDLRSFFNILRGMGYIFRIILDIVMFISKIKGTALRGQFSILFLGRWLTFFRNGLEYCLYHCYCWYRDINA